MIKNLAIGKDKMIPNCQGCEVELEIGLEYLDKGYDICFEGFGERKHLLIAVFDKEGRAVIM